MIQPRQLSSNVLSTIIGDSFPPVTHLSYSASLKLGIADAKPLEVCSLGPSLRHQRLHRRVIHVTHQ
jgi:hypothetical protein